MYLSNTYANKRLYAMVYHTGHCDGLEVELISDRLFSSKEKAEKWFAKHLKRKGRTADWYIDPHVVMVSGITKLLITDPAITESKPDQLNLEWT